MKTTLSKVTRNNKKFRKMLNLNPIQTIIDGHDRELFIIAKDEAAILNYAKKLKKRK